MGVAHRGIGIRSNGGTEQSESLEKSDSMK
jgi:hypothetical protein